MSNNKLEDYVERTRFQTEMIEKELRLQKLRTEFTFNPMRKVHILPDKPMCRRPVEEKEDPEILEVFTRAQMEPNKKYPYPLTESQEIGWISAPLETSERNGGIFNFRRFTTDVTQIETFTLRK